MDRNEEILKRKRNIESNVPIIVAELNDEVVGFCLYRNYISNPEKYSSSDCELSALYVKSTLKRNGIGRRLMEYVIGDLRSQGRKKMILGCLKDNYPSRAFYEKMGGKVFEYCETKFGEKQYSLAMYIYEI